MGVKIRPRIGPASERGWTPPKRTSLPRRPFRDRVPDCWCYGLFRHQSPCASAACFQYGAPIPPGVINVRAPQAAPTSKRSQELTGRLFAGRRSCAPSNVHANSASTRTYNIAIALGTMPIHLLCSLNVIAQFLSLGSGRPRARIRLTAPATCR